MLGLPTMSLHASRFDQQDWTTHVVSRPSGRTALVTATRDDAGRCIDILTQTFANDRALRWLYPERSEYLRWFPQLVRAFGRGAWDHGTAHLVNDCGAALWAPPESHGDDAALVELVQRSLPEDRRDAALALLEQREDYHPREPHWRLRLIGVEPRRQCKGYGSALLAHGMDRIDEENVPAYLEATSPENAALFERHGFEVIGVIQAQDSPAIFPMLRKPG